MLKYKLRVIKNRIFSIRKDLLLLLVTSLSAIILINFWLIQIPGKYDFQYTIGQFFLKLSFSYIAAFIFYFLVIHLPKQERKSNSYIFLLNNIVRIDYILNDLLTTIKFNAYPNWDIDERVNYSIWKVNKEDLAKSCKEVNPHNRVKTIIPYYPYFENWFDFINFQVVKIQSFIDPILILNDNVDNEVLEKLTEFMDVLKYIHFERIVMGNTTLEIYSGELYKIANNYKKLSRSFKKNYSSYHLENQLKYKIRDVEEDTI